jgi:hypothetical protein
MTIPVDHNKECWSAFCPDEGVAEKELQKAISKLVDKKLIVSAKKELIGDAKHTFHGLMLYKFTIVTSPRDK